MGLLKMAIDSVTGTLKDQQRTGIRCEDMGNDILLMKKSNQGGAIRDGSFVFVAPGQMAVLVDNGRIIDAAAEPGQYVFKTDSAPTFFGGSFGAMFKEMWTRFTLGGVGWQDQAVYYINATEIIGNRFGTAAPVMYRDWEHPLQNSRTGQLMPMRVAIRCSGSYTFEIHEPALFMKKIGGTALIYNKSELCDQMRNEIVSAFQEVLNSLCSEQNRVAPLDLPGKSTYLKQLMTAQVFDAAIRQRGIRLTTYDILDVQLDDDSKRKVDEYESSGDNLIHRQSIERDYAAAAMLAADNAAGPAMGFLNVNSQAGASQVLMGQMGGVGQLGGAGQVPSPMYTMPIGQQPAPQGYSAPPAQQAPAPQAPPAASGAACAKCGAALAGPFCAQCGTPAPAPAAPFCAQCGTKVSGAFCAQCGAKQ